MAANPTLLGRRLREPNVIAMTDGGQDELARQKEDEKDQVTFPAQNPLLELAKALNNQQQQQSAQGGPSVSDLMRMKNAMGGGTQASYMGGSGPAPGSFRGAQEVGMGSTSAAAPQSAGMSNMFGMTSGEGAGAMGPGLLYAYLIGKGKMMENERLKENPDDPMGNFGLAMLAPSGAQIMEDPKGMGLPTLLGAPFLTPFTASDKAKQTEPEWAGMWNWAGF